MIIEQLVWPMVLVGLPDADMFKQVTFSKPDYTTNYYDCQQSKNKNTMEYNYITTEEFIENMFLKNQNIFLP